MKRCTSCVLPDSVPGLLFDHSGVCSMCQTNDTPAALFGETAFKELLAHGSPGPAGYAASSRSAGVVTAATSSTWRRQYTDSIPSL